MARTSKRRTSRKMRRNDRRWGPTPIEEANRLIDMASARLDALLRGEAGYHREGNDYVMMADAFNYLLQADLTANALMFSDRKEAVEHGIDMRQKIQSICSGLQRYAEQARVSARAVDWVPR